MGRDDESIEVNNLEQLEQLEQEKRAEKVRPILQEVVDQMENERSEREVKIMFKDIVDQTKMIYDLGIEAGFDNRYAFALATEFFNGIVL